MVIGTGANKLTVDDRKIFIGGFTQDTTEGEIRAHFSQFGGVEHINIKRDQFTGKSRGFAFVIFDSVEALEECMQIKEHDIKGRAIVPRRAQSRPGKIFVGSLVPELTDEEIKEYFSQFGKVIDYEAPVDRERKRKNFVFVTFESEHTVPDCIAMPKQKINGHLVDVKKATPKDPYTEFGAPRGSGRGGFGRGGADFGRGGGDFGGRGGRGAPLRGARGGFGRGAPSLRAGSGFGGRGRGRGAEAAGGWGGGAGAGGWGASAAIGADPYAADPYAAATDSYAEDYDSFGGAAAGYDEYGAAYAGQEFESFDSGYGAAGAGAGAGADSSYYAGFGGSEGYGAAAGAGASAATGGFVGGATGFGARGRGAAAGRGVASRGAPVRGIAGRGAAGLAPRGGGGGFGKIRGTVGRGAPRGRPY